VHTVVETPTYIAAASALLSDEERARIVTMVAADSECGDVIAGTGGFRKARFGRQGKGKAAEYGSSTFTVMRGFLFF